MHKNVSHYSPFEEKINIYSHILGAALSFIALIILIFKALEKDSALALISFIIFSVSLIILYISSARYHSATDPDKRFKLKILDHSAIYVLIAGSYTPYALVTLAGKTGWLLFAASWTMAFIGVILKVFFTGRFKIISTLMYVFMGWIVLFVAKPLLAVFPIEGFYWLVAGGIAYTLGAIIYSIKKIKLNHAIFHIFVLIGSICHFFSIYYYV